MNNTVDKPVFERFDWGKVSNPDATVRAHSAVNFANRAKDVSAGVSDILSIIEHDQHTLMEGEECPMLSMIEHGNLMRLAITALDMLQEDADDLRNLALKQQHPRAL